MEEALTCLNIITKMLARRSNPMWDILLTSEEEAKTLAGCILTTKSVRTQTEYMGAERTKITLHGMPMDIEEEDLVGAFFTEYGQVEEITVVRSKTGIATGDIILQVTMSHKYFLEVSNILML